MAGDESAFGSNPLASKVTGKTIIELLVSFIFNVSLVNAGLAGKPFTANVICCIGKV